jgi:hypothetical protein
MIPGLEDWDAAVIRQAAVAAIILAPKFEIPSRIW